MFKSGIIKLNVDGDMRKAEQPNLCKGIFSF